MRLRIILTTLSAFTVTAFLAGCGSALMTESAADPGSGAVPTVSAVAEQVNGVAPNRKQEVQFSEAMDASTINAKTFIVTDSSGNAVSGMVTYDTAYDIASFQPNPPLQTDAAYKATISTGVASAGGEHLAAAYSYTFTTRATTDTSPLAINSVSPGANATCVSATTPIVITFNEGPDASTVNSTDIVVTGPSGTAIPVTMSINVTTTQVMVTPSSALPSGTITVTVQNVGDLADVKMTSPYTWSFSTACGSGGGGGGGASMQYVAPLFGNNADVGQITVDMAGNFTVQLKGATASQAYTVAFCPLVPIGQSTNGCFSVGAVSTDASGDGSLKAMFPKTGSWAGDFELTTGAVDPSGFIPNIETAYGPNYISTLVPQQNIDGGALNSGSGNEPQASLKSGTVTYSNSPAPYGSFTFTLTGAPPNTAIEPTEGNLYLGGSDNYALYNSQRQGAFTTDSQGDVTFTVLQDGSSGDILSLDVGDNTSGPGTEQGYWGGFSIP